MSDSGLSDLGDGDEVGAIGGGTGFYRHEGFPLEQKIADFDEQVARRRAADEEHTDRYFSETDEMFGTDDLLVLNHSVLGDDRGADHVRTSGRRRLGRARWDGAAGADDRDAAPSRTVRPGARDP